MPGVLDLVPLLGFQSFVVEFPDRAGGVKRTVELPVFVPDVDAVVAGVDVVLDRVRLVLSRAQPRGESYAVGAAVKVTEADSPVLAQVGVLSAPGAVQRVTDLPRDESRSPALQLNPELIVRTEGPTTVHLQSLLKVKPMNSWLSCRVEVFNIVTINSKALRSFHTERKRKFSFLFLLPQMKLREGK